VEKETAAAAATGTRKKKKLITGKKNTPFRVAI
jgi:hypothetical protein